MPKFNYIARNQTGQQVIDVIESPSRERVASQLRVLGLIPLQITEAYSKQNSILRYSWNPLDYQPINDKDIEFAFQQIAVMLQSGVALLDALNLTIKTCRYGAKKVWIEIANHVQQGMTLFDALSRHKQFTEFTLQMIYVGEQSGNLSGVMVQAARELKIARKLKSQIIVAVRYPLFSLFMAIGVCVLMLVKLVPEIKKVLKIFGKPLPQITQSLVDMSDWFLMYGYIILIVTSILFLASIFLYKTDKTRYWVDYFALYIPLLGEVFRMSGTVLFSRALCMLLRSGVLIVDSLATVEKLHRNKYIAKKVNETREKVIKGNTLAESMKNNYGFMPLMVHVLEIGENTGRMDMVLEEMTNHFEEQLEQRVAMLTGIIAPMMTIIVGGIIGYVYAAYLIGMFSATGATPR